MIGVLLGSRAGACEGGGTCEELVGQDAHGPVVNLVVVWSVIDYFGSQIVGRTTKCHPVLVDCVSAPAKVAELHMPKVFIASIFLGIFILGLLLFTWWYIYYLTFLCHLGGRIRFRTTHDQYIFWLYISVYHISLLKKPQGWDYLLNDLSRNIFLKVFLPS